MTDKPYDWASDLQNYGSKTLYEETDDSALALVGATLLTLAVVLIVFVALPLTLWWLV